MRSGMTLVEMLVTIALLSVVIVVMTTWTILAAKSQILISEALAWRTAAETSLQRIHEDIVSGSWSERVELEPRVTARNGELLIRSRSENGGSVLYRYHADAISGTLRRTTGAAGGESLVNQVNEFNCRLDQKKRLLSVTLTDSAGRQLYRGYRIP